MREKILVIRLGALGDLVLCCEAFARIRAHHPGAEIALLTMPAFAAFARAMPWFDQILQDPRPPAWRVDQWAGLIRRVRAFHPTRVYDLQGKPRQAVLFHALGGASGVEWSGAAKGCSHPRQWPPVPGMHYTDFVRAQLEKAFGGRHSAFGEEEKADWSWLDAPVDRFSLPEKFALLIPGCSPDKLYKRWPPESYAALALALEAQGIGSVAVGTKSEADALDALCRAAPAVVNLCNQTSLFELAALARRATWVVGNDTGPTHVAAAVGGRTLALMSDRVNPVWSAPKGLHAVWLQGKPLQTLPVTDVLKIISE